MGISLTLHSLLFCAKLSLLNSPWYHIFPRPPANHAFILDPEMEILQLTHLTCGTEEQCWVVCACLSSCAKQWLLRLLSCQVTVIPMSYLRQLWLGVDRYLTKIALIIAAVAAVALVTVVAALAVAVVWLSWVVVGLARVRGWHWPSARFLGCNLLGVVVDWWWLLVVVLFWFWFFGQ